MEVDLRKTTSCGYGSRIALRLSGTTWGESEARLFVLAARNVRGVGNGPPSKSKEGAGNAGCALHPWPPVQKESTGVSNQGYTATAGIPCAMVLRLIRDLPGDHAWLPPSPTRRVSVFASLAPASERQDHTTSPSAQPPLVAQELRPAMCVHRIPLPTSVTIASRPS